MLKLAPKHVRGMLAIVFSSLLWGTIPLILRQVDGSPFVKVFFRVFLSFVVMAFWLTLSGRWRRVTELKRPVVLWLFAQGALLGINWMLFFGALEKTNIATVELLGYMGPVFVAILAPLLLKYRFDRRIIVPLMFSLTGMLIVLIPHGFGLTAEVASTIGAAMALTSALTYATLIIMAKKIMAIAPIDVLTMIEGLGASLLLLPFVLWAYRQGNVPSELSQYGWLIVLGVVHTAFTGVLFFYGLKQLRPERAVVFTYIEPVSAILFAALFLAEGLTLSTIIGGILVIVGGTIVARIDAEEHLVGTPLEIPSVDEP